MNNLFNARRFGMLFVKHTTEHYKTYLMGLAVLTGVMLLGGSFLVYLIDEPLEKGLQTALFSSIYFLAGTIFTSTIFTDFGDDKKAVAALTLPASNFEKFLVGWLYSYVIFSLVFISIFYLILVILINLHHWPHQHTDVINVFGGQLSLLFVVFSLLHSIAILGAIYFKKLHFIKTAFCFFIVVLLLTLFNTYFLELLINHKIRPATPFANIYLTGADIFVSATYETNFMVVYVIMAVAIAFWLAAYYRLKEKQV